jgi:hypothetical protein
MNNTSGNKEGSFAPPALVQTNGPHPWLTPWAKSLRPSGASPRIPLINKSRVYRNAASRLSHYSCRSFLPSGAFVRIKASFLFGKTFISCAHHDSFRLSATSPRINPINGSLLYHNRTSPISQCSCCFFRHIGVSVLDHHVEVARANK